MIELCSEYLSVRFPVWSQINKTAGVVVLDSNHTDATNFDEWRLKKTQDFLQYKDTWF